jgi:hypothetical protein
MAIFKKNFCLFILGESIGKERRGFEKTYFEIIEG